MIEFQVPLHFEDLKLSSTSSTKLSSGFGKLTPEEHDYKVDMSRYQTMKIKDILALLSKDQAGHGKRHHHDDDDYGEGEEEEDHADDDANKDIDDYSSMCKWYMPNGRTDAFEHVYALVDALKRSKNQSEWKDVVVWMKRQLQALLAWSGKQHRMELLEGGSLANANLLDKESRKQCWKIAVFLACSMVIEAEKWIHERTSMSIAGANSNAEANTTKKSSLWSWEKSGRESLLSILLKVLETPAVMGLWENQPPAADFLNIFSRMFYSICESVPFSKDKASKPLAFQIMNHVAKLLDQNFQVAASLLHLCNQQEHVPVVVADLLIMASKEPFANVQLAHEVVKELSMSNGSELVRDTQVARNYASLLMEIADRNILILKPGLPLLMKHFNGESYLMRNAVLYILGQFVKLEISEIQKESAENNAGKQKEDEKAGQDSDDDEDNMGAMTDNDNHGSSLRKRKAEKRSVQQDASTALRTPSSEENTSQDALAAALERCEAHVETIISRCRDVNAFSRAKAIQVIASLVEENALPVTFLNQVTELGVHRLSDKATIVRKAAIQLLSTLLRFNQFGPLLTKKHFSSRLDQVKSASEHATPEEQVNQLADPVVRQAFAYYSSAVTFISQIEAALPKMEQLLRSQSITDVTEAIAFFIVALQFKVDGASKALRSMLILVLSREASIKQACVQAYKQLIFPPDVVARKVETNSPADDFSKQEALAIVRGLLLLIKGSTIGELTCIQGLIHELGIHTETMIQITCDILSDKVPKTTAMDRQNACILLGMLSSSSMDACMLLRSRLGSLFLPALQVSLEQQDLLMIQRVCETMRQVQTSIWESLDNTFENRASVTFDMNSALIGMLTRIIVELVPYAEQQGQHGPVDLYIAVLEEVVNTIFSFCDEPHSAMERIMVELSSSFDSALQPKEEGIPLLQEAEGYAYRQLSDAPGLDSSYLAKFVFLVGHIAMKQLISIESDMSKLRQSSKKKMKELGTHANPPNMTDDTKKRGSKAAKSAGGAGGVSDHTADNPTEEETDELAMTMTSDDLEYDAVMNHAEAELFSSQSIVGRYVPLIVAIASDQSCSNPYLRTTAVLSLTKLMAVSSKFCHQNLQLAFSILQAAKEPCVRANIVVSLGDLAFRFPNLVEPWSSHIYTCLDDGNLRVRRNALMVLTHLILNDMIKIKGQIVSMALRLHDEDVRIADLAKMFFFELSRKGSNLVYNVLPDVLSCLVARKDITSDQFKSLMRFLIGFIKQDRQVEGTVEKLCQRFRMTKEMEDWRHIAHCLTFLQYGDRSFKKLIEMFRSFADKLYDDEIHQSFVSICSKSKKMAKPDHRALVEEFELRMEKIRTVGSAAELAAAASATPGKSSETQESMVESIAAEIENIALDGASSVSKKRPKETPRRSAMKKPKNVGRAAHRDDKENSETPANKQRPKAKTQGGRIKANFAADNNDADADADYSKGEDPMDISNSIQKLKDNNRRPARNAATNRRIIIDEEEE